MDAIWAIAFSPDGKYLSSAGWDGSIRIWDVGTCTQDFKIRSLSKVTRTSFMLAYAAHLHASP